MDALDVHIQGLGNDKQGLMYEREKRLSIGYLERC